MTNRDAILFGSICAFLGLVVVPGLTLLFYFAIRNARAYVRALDVWVARRGVQLTSGYPTPAFRAVLDNVEVQLIHPVVIQHHRQARRRRYRFHLQVAIPVPLGDLTVRHRGNLASQLIDFVFQEQDIEVGDAAFDQAYVIQTTQVDAARALLDRRRREAFDHAQRELTALALPTVLLNRNALHLTGENHFPVEKLDAAIAILARLTHALAR